MRDQYTGKISSFEKSWVYKNKGNNTKQSTFNLISPADGSIITPLYYADHYYMILDWTDSVDDNHITYTIELSKDDSTFSSPIRIERLSSSTMILQINHHIDFNTLYYWRVIAIDEFGAKSISNYQSFKALSPNNILPAGPFGGCVHHINTKQIIPYAHIFSDNKGYRNIDHIGDDGKGCYQAFALYNYKYKIIGKGKYYHQNAKEFEFNSNTNTRINIELKPMADINFNGKIELEDVIIALQVLSGILEYSSKNPIDMQADMNNDNKIDLIEIIYLLNRLGDFN